MLKNSGKMTPVTSGEDCLGNQAAENRFLKQLFSKTLEVQNRKVRYMG